jgi:hypothetical protein
VKGIDLQPYREEMAGIVATEPTIVPESIGGYFDECCVLVVDMDTTVVTVLTPGHRPKRRKWFASKYIRVPLPQPGGVR